MLYLFGHIAYGAPACRQGRDGSSRWAHIRHLEFNCLNSQKYHSQSKTSKGLTKELRLFFIFPFNLKIYAVPLHYIAGWSRW